MHLGEVVALYGSYGGSGPPCMHCWEVTRHTVPCGLALKTKTPPGGGENFENYKTPEPDLQAPQAKFLHFENASKGILS